jgi:hypothetical protein
MEGSRLEVDENFGGAISSKFRDFAETAPPAPKHLRGYCLISILENVVLEIFDAVRGCSKCLFFLICLYSKWKQRHVSHMHPILRDAYASTSKPFAIISSN